MTMRQHVASPNRAGNSASSSIPQTHDSESHKTVPTKPNIVTVPDLMPKSPEPPKKESEPAKKEDPKKKEPKPKKEQTDGNLLGLLTGDELMNMIGDVDVPLCHFPSI